VYVASLGFEESSLEYIHEMFGNNVNAKTVKGIEEITTAIAILHNIIIAQNIKQGGVILT